MAFLRATTGLLIYFGDPPVMVGLIIDLLASGATSESEPELAEDVVTVFVEFGPPPR